MSVTTYEQLDVWKKAHAVVLDVYRITLKFPSDERFGLINQVRRSAASTPANIAEGFRRSTKPDKARFYNIALCSMDETRYHLLLAHDLGYANTEELRRRADEVTRMLSAYTKAIEASERVRKTRNTLIAAAIAGTITAIAATKASVAAPLILAFARCLSVFY
ncbi:MAG TPA: four helix bundle protein [Tepidisphaeraceae bacterium]|nr:four helix bundle protein [Tepidisphaeraceae bacterium]